MTDPAVTYAQLPARRRAVVAAAATFDRVPSTMKCCSSSSTRSTSCGSSSSCTNSTARRSCWTADDTHRVQHTLKRILTILKVMVAQLDILETMTPLEACAFRERLDAASGFQSDQFRQIEFILGVKNDKAIRAVSGGQPRPHRARTALRRTDNLGRLPPGISRAEGYPIPAAHLAARLSPSASRRRRRSRTSSSRCTGTTEERRALRAAGRSRRRDPGVAVSSREDGRADDRREAGTGGSTGAEYLRNTVGRNLFPDLWEIRSQL